MIRFTLSLGLFCLYLTTLTGLDSLHTQLVTLARAHPPSANMDLRALSTTFAKVATTDYQKAEIAFYWIAEHFELDFEGGAAKADYNLNELLSRQRGGMRTFSQLYQELCQAAGLQAYLVPGYTNDYLRPSTEWEPVYSYKTRDLPSRPYHTWNVVKIANEYLFVDVAFGFGAFEGGMDAEHFVKKYDLTQILENGSPFTLTHLPADPCWQMRERPISMQTYYTNMPFEEMVAAHADDPVYDYEADIRKYEQATNAQRQLIRLERSLSFHPIDPIRRELANAAASRAYELALLDYNTDRMILARRYYRQAIEHYRALPKDDSITALIQQAEQGVEYVSYRLDRKQ